MTFRWKEWPDDICCNLAALWLIAIPQLKEFGSIINSEKMSTLSKQLPLWEFHLFDFHWPVTSLSHTTRTLLLVIIIFLKYKILHFNLQQEKANEPSNRTQVLIRNIKGNLYISHKMEYSARYKLFKQCSGFLSNKEMKKDIFVNLHEVLMKSMQLWELGRLKWLNRQQKWIEWSVKEENSCWCRISENTEI